MRWIALIFIPTLCLPLLGQKIAVSDAAEDLKQLQAAIVSYNPALYDYNPDFDFQSDQLIDGLQGDSLSHLQFFQKLSRLCALSNEGHFALGNWEDTVHQGFLRDQYRYMPVSVAIIDGKLIVSLDCSNERALHKGDEILAINGTFSDEILRQYYQCYPADGIIKTFVDRTLEMGFNWLYYLYIDQPQTFEFTILDSTQTKRTVTVEALFRSRFFENYHAYYPNRAQNEQTEGFCQLELENETAYLTLPSFDRAKMEAHNIKPKAFYKNLFKRFEEEHIKNLVIDLRNNMGGRNEMADAMVPYIAQNQRAPAYLKKTISWELKERTYRFPKPSKHQFKGDIYVLINGRTYSAASSLARYLKEYGKATIIGEESGTRYEGFAAGSTQEVTLLHSQIPVGIPRYHILFPASKQQKTRNRGVLPHHTVVPNIASFKSGRDLVLQEVTDLITR